MDQFARIFKLPSPPGLTYSAMAHCPQWLRDDALQAAWVAHKEGRKPDSAVRALVRHEQRHKATKPNFDLCPAGTVRRRF
ncbi:MAG: hypothetical protein SGJ20_04290 [Planctomycetota bacterium]|nr:hypothetical protein [Planctomycetota bacterium]